MIVADTGNNRLQLFRVLALPVSPHAPASEDIATEVSDSRSADIMSDSFNTNPIGDLVSLDGSTDNEQWSTGLDVTWTRSHTPSHLVSRDAPGVKLPQETPATLTTAGDDGDDDVEKCLLAFTGGEHIGQLRKCRTAGETEEGEGPLHQPSDVAYWRKPQRRKRQRGDPREQKNDDRATLSSAVVWAWTPSIPPWFRSYNGRRDGSKGCDSVDSAIDKEQLRVWLLSAVHTTVDCHRSPADGRRTRIDIEEALSDGGVAKEPQKRERSESKSTCRVREPKIGSFVVRETGIPGQLQLLFVARRKVVFRLAFTLNQ